MNIKGIKRRLYADFFRPSKEDDYERIIKTAKDNGYEFHTVLSFVEVVKNGIDADKKYLILRRDIDTSDFKILRKFLEIEKKYGARSTSYFRWNTINTQLMADIEKWGGESSYHYEEIASFCYQHRIRKKDDAIERMEEIRDLFIVNIEKFRKKTGMSCLTVASHGDYVNTKFQFQNKELMNERVRKETGIIREAYDPEHMSALTFRIADQVEGDKTTAKVLEALERGEPVLEVLTHPRQWNSPIWVNLKEEIVRICKGLYMRL